MLRTRMRAYAYTVVTTAIVLSFALAEWGAERFVAAHSRAAGTAIEITIVLIAALVFRPIHQRVDAAFETAFYKRKRQALSSLGALRREMPSFNDSDQLLRRLVEGIEHFLDARACAIYVLRDVFRASASSFDMAAPDVMLDDPLAIRLRSSGAPARPQLLQSAACGTLAFPMMVAGDLIGFISVDARPEGYDIEEMHMLSGLASDLAVALLTLDPVLRGRKSGTPNNIPDLPPLVGREREVAEINAALMQSRLVTITGVGGVGKTRVALQCAVGAIARHEHGAWFIDLAPISDERLVAAHMLVTLDAGGVKEGQELTHLIEFLRQRDALLVIDNCEQVIATVASIVAQIRQTCPQVMLLATSRELLRLDGEQVYRLGPLRLKDAAELFSQRAAAIAPEFVAHEHRKTVQAICERLDGIPLALELAAARVRVLSPEEILDHLRERFRLLTGGDRAALPRQQTLEATVQWSYDLLTSEEQSLLRRLTIFRGSFALAAAAAVCAFNGRCDEFHVLDLLTSLADKSLLTVRLAPATRYLFLETIREFAAQQATEKKEHEATAQQHATYFSSVAAHAYHEFDSQLPRGWLEGLAPDLDNFRAALEWMLEDNGDRGTGAQTAADCGPLFLRLQSLGEGLRWCAAARAITPLPPATAGRIEYVASMLHNNLGENQAALTCAERAVEFYEQSSDERGLVRALSQLAQLYGRNDRFEDAKAPAREAMRRARSLAEPRVLISVLRRCAFSLPPAEIVQARELFSEALSVARSANDTEEACIVLQWWATREAAAGCLDRAIELANEGLQCAAPAARLPLESQLACWSLALGKLDEAMPHAREALMLVRHAQHPLARAMAIAYYSPVLAAKSPRDGAMLFGYATAQLSHLGWEAQADDRLALQTAAGAIEARFRNGEFEELTQNGASWTEEQALSAAILD